MAREPLQVLIVEDNAGDVFLIKESMKACVNCELHVVTNGDRALHFLTRHEGFATAARPDLVILDLNLPGREGGEVLEYIRHTPELKDVTVAVVSSSPTDVMKKRAVQADCYVKKPSELDEFLAIGREILACHQSRSRRSE